MQKTIVWDVGGVILRTENHQPRQKLAQSFNLSEHQLAQIFFGDDDDLRAQKGLLTSEQHFKNVAKKLNIQEKEIAEFKRQFFAGDLIDQEIIKWIQENRSKYQITILSNAMDELRNELKEKHHISHFFDHIFISAEMGLAKPNPQIFHTLINQLGKLPQNIFFIDDNIDNIKAAQKIGINTIHFINRTQAIDELENKLKE